MAYTSLTLPPLQSKGYYVGTMAATATSIPSLGEQLAQLMQVIKGWEAMKITFVSGFYLNYYQATRTDYPS